jgi:hypothetical protein
MSEIPTATRRAALPCAALPLLAAALLAAAPVAAQSPGAFSHPMDLFADMAADTATRGDHGITEPVPHVRLEGAPPAPGLDLFGIVRTLVCADFDRDGYTDVVMTSGSVARAGGDPSEARLLWGRADGFFEVADPSPLPPHVADAVRGDLDGDGLTDLVILEVAGGELARTPGVHTEFQELPTFATVVLRNLGGRRFAREPLGGVLVEHFTLADLDGDGWLDLAGFLKDVTYFSFDAGSPALVARRGGPGGFAPPVRHDPAALPEAARQGFIWTADLDLDGRPEPRLNMGLFRAMDVSIQPGLLLHDLTGRLRFEPSGVVPATGYGRPSLIDIDGDGRPDIFAGATDMAGGRNLLRLSAGRDGAWTDLGSGTGLWAGYAYTMGAWGDVDNDGHPDLWQARMVADDARTRSRLYWNRGDHAFVDVTAAAVSPPAEPSSQSAVWLDADRDGRLDLLAAFSTSYSDIMPVRECRPILYHNCGEAGAWLSVRLAGAPPNTDAIGASVVLWSRGRGQWRQVGDGSSDGGTSPPLELHFGLGEADRADSVVVRWPWGPRQVWRDLEAGRRHVLRQR